jgi:uncharacterized protein YyaL (SSP411 family)
MTGNVELEKKADEITRAFARQIGEQPIAYTQMLNALGFMLGPSQEVVIAGDPSLETTQAMVNAVRSKFLPNKVLLLHPDGKDGKRLVTISPFLKDMVSAGNQPTAYVCEQYACQTPIQDVGKLKSALH